MTPDGRQAAPDGRQAPPDEPQWPAHHSDAPPPRDPRSLSRGLLAGAGVLLLAAALALVAPVGGQERILLLLLGWIAAVVLGRWAYRGDSRLAVPVSRWTLVLAVVALVGAGALVLISFEVRDILSGSVVFGRAGSGCDVEAETETFATGDAVYAVAHTRRVVEPGEAFTLRLRRDGELVSETTDDTARAFDCLGSPLTAGGPGSYTLEAAVQDESLAEGSFIVTSDP